MLLCLTVVHVAGVNYGPCCLASPGPSLACRCAQRLLQSEPGELLRRAIVISVEVILVPDSYLILSKAHAQSYGRRSELLQTAISTIIQFFPYVPQVLRLGIPSGLLSCTSMAWRVMGLVNVTQYMVCCTMWLAHKHFAVPMSKIQLVLIEQT